MGDDDSDNDGRGGNDGSNNVKLTDTIDNGKILIAVMMIDMIILTVDMIKIIIDMMLSLLSYLIYLY